MIEKDKKMRFLLISGIVLTLLLAGLLLVSHFTSRQPVPIVPPAAQVLSDIEAKYPLLTKEQRFVFAVQTLVQEYGYPAEQAKSEVEKLLD